MKPYIFRIIREKVDGETVRITLEPYTDLETVAIHDGDEFITGTLNSNLWDKK